MKKAFSALVLILTIIGGFVFNRIVLPQIESFLPPFLSSSFITLILQGLFIVLFVIVIVALFSLMILIISWAIGDGADSEKPSTSKPMRKLSPLKKTQKQEDEKMPWEL